MSLLRPLTLALGLSHNALAAAANFSMPTVDLSPNVAGSSAMLAVWSATDALVPVSTTVSIILPDDYSLPSNVSSPACTCVFLRHTSTSAGAWAVSEVTITAATLQGQMLSISMPADVHPGKFYIRFDATAGLVNPATYGMSTLAMVDPAGNKTLSRGFYIRPSFTASVLGAITGTVKNSSGKAMPGALVMATTMGAFLPLSIGARKGYVDALTTTQNVYSTAVASDGSYTLSVPAGTYSIRAEVWRHKNYVLQSASSEDPNPAVVSTGGTAISNFSLTLP